MTGGAADSVAAQTRRAYERWAPLYPPVAHNPLMRAEQHAMMQLWPKVAGRRALDLACGSGRYSNILAGGGAGEVVGVDSCAAMLAQLGSARRVCASMMSLPFRDAAFDALICGLALGHATDVGRFMAEVGRVLATGGDLLYSDIHPDAVRAGLSRSFKDRDERTCTVPHRCFEMASQRAAIEDAGLSIQAVDEVRVGYELTETFPKCDDFYGRWHGLPIVLVVRACK